jgi:peptide-methionine (R)-S-oxide reductase
MHSRLDEEKPMTRKTHEPDHGRRWLIGAGCAGLAALGGNFFAGRTGPGAATAAAATEVSIENFSPAGTSLGTVKVPKVVKSEAEWRSQLSTLAYQVTRRAGTEAAFSGEYAETHADGLYRCVCCDTALFDSRTKFDSGTGWPSFWQPISAKNVAVSSDTSFGMLREAVACSRCDSHLGRFFLEVAS